jgi:hypothetical protein
MVSVCLGGDVCSDIRAGLRRIQKQNAGKKCQKFLSDYVWLQWSKRLPSSLCLRANATDAQRSERLCPAISHALTQIILSLGTSPVVCMCCLCAESILWYHSTSARQCYSACLLGYALYELFSYFLCLVNFSNFTVEFKNFSFLEPL